MIRDLNKKLGKKMELYMSGEDTELDRTVIDEIGDPIMHLLRNSADHGLESAEIRKERGKSCLLYTSRYFYLFWFTAYRAVMFLCHTTG